MLCPLSSSIYEGIQHARNYKVETIITGAKPQAEIRYTLVEGGDNALIQELEKLTGTEEAMLSIKPTRYYNDAVIRCEVVHETIMQDDDYQNVWTKTISLDVRNRVQDI